MICKSFILSTFIIYSLVHFIMEFHHYFAFFHHQVCENVSVSPILLVQTSRTENLRASIEPQSQRWKPFNIIKTISFCWYSFFLCSIFILVHWIDIRLNRLIERWSFLRWCVFVESLNRNWYCRTTNVDAMCITVLPFQQFVSSF